MKKYLSFFRLRFHTGLQYRAAALAGIVTQFVWGILAILAFDAFYRADAAAFPMTLQATCSYIWIQQTFLALFAIWALENEIFEAIRNGDVVYEMCRPIDIYRMWFARSLATRLSRAVLRCMPILVLAVLLPAPYGLAAPVSAGVFVMFLVRMVLGSLVMTAICMVVYMITFFTVSADGVRMVAVSLAEILSGAIIPLPFFPDKIRGIVELLPFAAGENVPLRIYSGDLAGKDAWLALGLQVFWLAALIFIGTYLMNRASNKIVVQGG